MKNRNVFLYIAGACFFAMCGSLWNEFVASDKSVNPSVRNSVNPNIRDSVVPSFRGSKARYYAVPKTAVESFPFDPNEADSTQLLRLGLTPAQVRSIYRHRAKGYVYSTPEDFARTPFMTKGQWNHLKPLIKIGDQYRPLNANVNDNDNENANIRPRRAPQQARLIEAEPSRMSMERSYMNRPPITDNPAPITDNRSPITDTLGAQPRTVNSHLSTVNLNESSFKDLVHHPFLSYDQVKAVKNFQRKYGRIRNMTELLILPEFTVEDTLRLSPYLQF